MAKGVSKLLGVPLCLDALGRTRATLPQGQEGKHERYANMRGAFEVCSKFKDQIQGKSVVLIDDVMTTGATLNTCAEALLPYSPKKISSLTLSKALLS